jgi:hypothetical protein
MCAGMKRRLRTSFNRLFIIKDGIGTCGLIHRNHDIGGLYHRIDLIARGKF